MAFGADPTDRARHNGACHQFIGDTFAKRFHIKQQSVRLSGLQTHVILTIRATHASPKGGGHPLDEAAKGKGKLDMKLICATEPDQVTIAIRNGWMSPDNAMDIPMGNFPVAEKDIQPGPGCQRTARRLSMKKIPKNIDAEKFKAKNDSVWEGMNSNNAANILTSPPPRRRKANAIKPTPKTMAPADKRHTTSLKSKSGAVQTKITTEMIPRKFGMRKYRRSQYATAIKTGAITISGMTFMTSLQPDLNWDLDACFDVLQTGQISTPTDRLCAFYHKCFAGGCAMSMRK
jgi:hypothetical protein